MEEYIFVGFGFSSFFNVFKKIIIIIKGPLVEFYKLIKYIHIVGVTDRGAHTNIHVGPRAQSKGEPLLGHGKNPSSTRCGRRQRKRPITERGTPGHSME